MCHDYICICQPGYHGKNCDISEFVCHVRFQKSSRITFELRIILVIHVYNVSLSRYFNIEIKRFVLGWNTTLDSAKHSRVVHGSAFVDPTRRIIDPTRLESRMFKTSDPHWPYLQRWAYASIKQVRKELRGNSHEALFSGCTVLSLLERKLINVSFPANW